jgi:hypothetical protein
MFTKTNKLPLFIFLWSLLYNVDALRGQNGCAGDNFNDGNKGFPINKNSILSPFDPRFEGNCMVFRGKVLPYMAFGNNRGINYSVGFEYGFKVRNSISLDLIYNDFQNLTDVYDTAKKQFVEGSPKYMVDRGAFLSYRYYFSKFAWRDKKGITPYASAFLRFGNHQYLNYEGLVTNTVSEMQWHYSGGFLIGFLKTFQTRRECFGIDVNAGFYEKEKIFHTVYADGNSECRSSWYTNARLGVNFYYWIYRSNKK